jgi:hypothetical protein
MNNTEFSAAHTIVLGDPFVMDPLRLTDRVLARTRGASLDHQLAAGCPPESTRLLAVRAQDIVALPRRVSLADNWAHLLRAARRAPSRRTPAVPLRAAAILAAEPAIHELRERLTAPLPVGAQGVATASVLLTDPTSPVYSRRSPRTFADQLHAAIVQLDPATPLMHAALPASTGGDASAGSWVLGWGHDDARAAGADTQRQPGDQGRRGDDLRADRRSGSAAAVGR